MGMRSADLERFLKHCYTFGFVALATQYLPLEEVTAGGVKIALGSLSLVSKTTGALALLSSVMAGLCYARDRLQTRIKDGQSFKYSNLSSVEGLFTRPQTQSVSERFQGPFKLLQRSIAVVQIALPSLFGVAAFVLVWFFGLPNEGDLKGSEGTPVEQTAQCG